MDLIAIYVATGVIAGLIAGLFGVGGGLIIVPALSILLSRADVAPDIVMQVAIATSLSVISATSISSTWAHHKNAGVRWPLVRYLAPGLTVGALAGASVAHVLSGDSLRIIVGVGAIGVALKMALELQPSATRKLPAASGLLAAGGVIGSISALIGIGGGSLTVPFLSISGVPIRQAVGTSAACGLPIAWAGAIGMVIAGWSAANLPAGNLGYVSMPGFAAIAGASVLTAPLGAHLAHRLPQKRLRQGFAALLLLVGLRMLWDGLIPG